MTRILSLFARLLARPVPLVSRWRCPCRHGNDVRVERIERFVERVVIERNRALQERAARERDQADAVAVQVATKSATASLARVKRLGLTSGVSMLFEVSTAKMISIPRRCHFLPAEAGLGPRECDEKTGACAKEQAAFPVALDGGERLRESA